MTKDEFKIYARHAINDISNRIDELRQRANSVDSDIAMEFNEKVTELIEQRDTLTQLADDFDDTIEDNWLEAKKEFSKGLAYLQSGFEKLFNILSH